MTLDELKAEILKMLPDAVFDEEFGTGEIMIATGKVARIDDGELKDVTISEPF